MVFTYSADQGNLKVDISGANKLNDSVETIFH